MRPVRPPQPLRAPDRVNAAWRMDIVYDTRYVRRTFRTLIVIYDADRSVLGIKIAISLAAAQVVRFLDQLIDVHRKSAAIRCGNGPELTSEKLADWSKGTGVAIRFIQTGKPNQHAFIERFNRSYREEVLDAYLFNTRDEVREITDNWIERYSEIRSHDALASLPPAWYRSNRAANSSCRSAMQG